MHILKMSAEIKNDFYNKISPAMNYYLIMMVCKKRSLSVQFMNYPFNHPEHNS